MDSRLKVGAVIVGLLLGLYGCAEVDTASGGHVNAGTSSATPVVQQAEVPVVQQVEAPSKPISLIVPANKVVAAAMNAAIPNITKVLGIHRCIVNFASLRQMNLYAVTGVDIGNRDYPQFMDWAPVVGMKYHDKGKCVSVQTIDQWAMPALNALTFRVVYFAEDSGEVKNFTYLFKKVDDGSWKIATFDLDRREN